MATPLRPDADARVLDGVVPLVGFREWAVEHASDGAPTLRSCSTRPPGRPTARSAPWAQGAWVVRGWGRYVLRTAGWRCDFAAVSAIAADVDDPALGEALAERYRVPLVRSLAVEEIADVRPTVGC
jgi:hypothetical protein